MIKPGDHYRHKKRGTTYIVTCIAPFQCENEEFDDAPVVIYRDLKSGNVWVRPLKEFVDGRFEKL